MLPSQADYTGPAIDAITRAASTEHDFPGWLAHVLASAAARLGSSNALMALPSFVIGNPRGTLGALVL